MKKLFWLLSFLGLSPAVWADVWINPGFYSYHLQRDQDLNSANTGLGVEASLTSDYSFTAGFFKNSVRDTSHYVGVYAMPFSFGGFKAGAALGAFDGYPLMNKGGWFPAIVPTMELEGRQFGLNISFIPTIGDRLHGAVTFQVKYKLSP